MKRVKNVLNSALFEKSGAVSKISAFLAYVYKIKAYFDHLQMVILHELFKLFVAHFKTLKCRNLILFNFNKVSIKLHMLKQSCT